MNIKVFTEASHLLDQPDFNFPLKGSDEEEEDWEEENSDLMYNDLAVELEYELDAMDDILFDGEGMGKKLQKINIPTKVYVSDFLIFKTYLKKIWYWPILQPLMLHMNMFQIAQAAHVKA